LNSSSAIANLTIAAPNATVTITDIVVTAQITTSSQPNLTDLTNKFVSQINIPSAVVNVAVVVGGRRRLLQQWAATVSVSNLANNVNAASSVANSLTSANFSGVTVSQPLAAFQLTVTSAGGTTDATSFQNTIQMALPTATVVAKLSAPPPPPATPASSPSPLTAPPTSSSSNTGLIIGSAAGGAAALVVVGVGFWFLYKGKRRDVQPLKPQVGPKRWGRKISLN
jgi:hypothetical protein